MSYLQIPCGFAYETHYGTFRVLFEDTQAVSVKNIYSFFIRLTSNLPAIRKDVCGCAMFCFLSSEIPAQLRDFSMSPCNCCCRRVHRKLQHVTPTLETGRVC